MGFYHEGTEVWYTEDNNDYKVCTFDKEDKKCSDKLIDYTMSDHCNYLGRNICTDC